MREHEYEITAHYNNDKVVGTVWWDGKKVQTSSTEVENMLEGRSIQGKFMKDGPEFLKLLPQLFNNGYVSARKKK